MARYIDADTLLENLKKQYGEELGWQCTINVSDIGAMIEDAPAADVVPRSVIAEIFDAIDESMIRDHIAMVMRVDKFIEIKKKYMEGEQ